MSLPRTLLQIAETSFPPPAPAHSALILVDAQLEYVEGGLALPGIGPALSALGLALRRARAAGVPVIHVVHHGEPGSALFDPQGPFVAIAPEVAPIAGEHTLIKRLPNAFSGTGLEALLRSRKVRTPVLAGFMTHMCISSTARAAMELGFGPQVVGDACAARSLPDGRGGVLEAADVHDANLAALADRFAGVIAARALWPAEGGDPVARR